jgi:hypothetical protein
MNDEEVKKRVCEAYNEGFQDGEDHGNLSYKYPPLHVAWLQSQTRVMAKYAPLTAFDLKEIQAWKDMNYEERVKS